MSFTYDNMKRQLKAISDNSTTLLKTENFDIKAEPVYYVHEMRETVIKFPKIVIETQLFKPQKMDTRKTHKTHSRINFHK